MNDKLNELLNEIKKTGNLYHENMFNAVAKFRGDFEVIKSNEHTFKELDEIYNKNINNIQTDLEYLIIALYIMEKALDEIIQNN